MHENVTWINTSKSFCEGAIDKSRIVVFDIVIRPPCNSFPVKWNHCLLPIDNLVQLKRVFSKKVDIIKNVCFKEIQGKAHLLQENL